MLQQKDNGIYEVSKTALTASVQTLGNVTFGNTTKLQKNGDYYVPSQWPYQQTVYWNSYPVYVYTDKTKKAIEVLKALQAEKLLKCDSVPRFIELVEKISNIL